VLRGLDSNYLTCSYITLELLRNRPSYLPLTSRMHSSTEHTEIQPATSPAADASDANSKKKWRIVIMISMLCVLLECYDKCSGHETRQRLGETAVLTVTVIVLLLLLSSRLLRPQCLPATAAPTITNAPTLQLRTSSHFETGWRRLSSVKVIPP
jgi:hypothetical protein